MTMIPIYSYSRYQYNPTPENKIAAELWDRLKARLMSEGIAFEEESTDWRECERLTDTWISGPKGGGPYIDLDCSCLSTLSVPEPHAEQARRILEEIRPPT
jgi:hypothetical protein